MIKNHEFILHIIVYRVFVEINYRTAIEFSFINRFPQMPFHWSSVHCGFVKANFNYLSRAKSCDYTGHYHNRLDLRKRFMCMYNYI